jgi:ribosomal-protein-alanine N-acetyltransferase
MMSIRRAIPEDLKAILRIETKSFARDAWNRDQFLDYLAQPKRTVFLVATINGIVIAYAIGWHTATRAEIDSIAVSPAERDKGVAIMLLRRVLNALRRRGLPAVSLNVRLDNHSAIRLYQKLGFERTRRISGYYEDGSPALRMRRTL